MSEDIHKWTDGRYTLMFDEHTFFVWDNENDERMTALETTKKLNEQQELIEELHTSDHMGWGRAKKFEKELEQKKIYIKRLEYKVQKFKEMNGEQQSTIEMYQRRVDKREKQIDIMKFHILNFCTDEQIQSIRNDLEIESKLRRCKK